MINDLKVNNKNKTFTSLDLKLIFIIIFALGFIVSIFLIIKNRVFLTRYEQLFLSDFKSFLDNSETTLVGFINNFPMLNGFYTLFFNITSIKPTKILIFPFGFILFPLTIYFFVSTFNKKFNKTAFIGALFFFVFYFYTKYLQVGYVGALTIPIVLLFTAQMVRIFKKRNIIQNIILGILELVYLVGMWHSAGFYVIALIGGLVGVYLVASLIQAIIIKIRKDNSIKTNSFLKPKISLFLFFGILLIGSLVLNIKEDLLLNYLELFRNRFLGGNFIENIRNVFIPLFNRLFNRSDYPLSENTFEYSYTSLTSGKIYFIVNVFLHIFSAFLLIIGLITMIIRTIKNKDNKFLIWIIFGFSLLLAQLIFYILYSATGVNLFFIAVIFPVVGVYFIRKLGWKKFSAISMGLFLGFATIMSVSSIASNQFSNNTGSTIEENIYSFDWLANNTNSNSIVILDFNLHGRYLQYAVDNNLTIDYLVYYLDSTQYSYLTGINNPPQKYNSSWYFVFDIQTMNNRKAFDIYEKRGLLISRLDLININPDFALVYNDGLVGIYNYRFN